MSGPTIQATGKLPPQEWMIAAESVALFKALQAGGKEARFVGGCVRNAVFGLPVKDIDIATPETPERVIELLQAAGIRAIPTGIEHGTVTAVIGERHFEVTTLRVDVESHGRHATVAFTDDWLADAKRRDFTINTLSCSLAGDIYDPLTGLDDLGQRWVRFVGRARDRIEEDVLRLLRFFRFHANFGKTTMDRDALAACRLLAPRLQELSPERVRSELFRILEAPNPADTFRLMAGEKILTYILPEAHDFGRLRMMAWLETTAIKVDSVQPNTLRRLAATLTEEPDGHSALSHRLRLSNKQAHQLSLITNGRYAPTPEDTQMDHNRILYDLDAEGFRDLVLLGWAGEMSVNPRHTTERTDAWLALIDRADNWRQPVFPIGGDDAMALGLVPGPNIGATLGAVENWWRDGGFKADRTHCITYLETIIKDMP